MGGNLEFNKSQIVGGFPPLKTEVVIKFDDHLGQINVDEFEIGQFVVMRESFEDQHMLSLLQVDELDALHSSLDELGARVSQIEGMAVTLEVVSPFDGSSEG